MKAGVRSQESEVRRRSAPARLSLTTLPGLLCAVAFGALLILATGCSLKATRGGIPPQAQAVIDATTSDIADGNYERIYTEAAQEWRQAATPEQSNATFKTLRDKLGNVKGRSFHSATEQDATDGHTFVITYKTTFDRADGMETFTLVERDGRWLLARYFVNSDALK
jgi:uncharacterized protein DUF4019